MADASHLLRDFQVPAAALTTTFLPYAEIGKIAKQHHLNKRAKKRTRRSISLLLGYEGSTPRYPESDYL